MTDPGNDDRLVEKLEHEAELLEETARNISLLPDKEALLARARALRSRAEGSSWVLDPGAMRPLPR